MRPPRDQLSRAGGIVSDIPRRVDELAFVRFGRGERRLLTRPAGASPPPAEVLGTRVSVDLADVPASLLASLGCGLEERESRPGPPLFELVAEDRSASSNPTATNRSKGLATELLPFPIDGAGPARRAAGAGTWSICPEPHPDP